MKKELEEHIKVISFENNSLELEISEEGEEILKLYMKEKNIKTLENAIQDIIKKAVYLNESKQRINTRVSNNRSKQRVGRKTKNR